MGAWNFQNTEVAKTPEQAFKTAVDNARWEHGNGGYTGTIAEKPGFVLFTLPPRVTVAKFLGWIASEEASGMGVEYAREDLHQIRMAGLGKAQILAAEKTLRQAEKDAARFWKTVPEAARETVRKAARLYNQKWNEAVAVEMTGAERKAFLDRRPVLKQRGIRVFVFAGLASS